MNKGDSSGFLWGAATSAFQIEGQIDNDMTVWEQQGKFRNNSKDPRVGDAIDHWSRWEEDFRLLKEIGLNSYRFSIEWARIEPEPYLINKGALDQYSRMIDRLLDYEITPMVTLHHFTHPIWFHSRCPWHQSRAIECYLRFVNLVSSRLLDRVPLVITFNEPLVWALAAYGAGKFPPGENNLKHLMTAFKNMLLAHREAYDLIKQNHPQSQIGIAHNFVVFKRAPNGIEMDRKVKRLIHHFYNRMILEAFMHNRLKASFPLILSYDSPIELNDKIDFWGINYYHRLHVQFQLKLHQPFKLFSLARSSGEGQSDLGWEIYPRGLQKVCNWLKTTKKTLYITENGIAVQDDAKRLKFIASHLNLLDEIISEGHPVKGYYHWSLLDNYEWLEGTQARFGLCHVDYDRGMKRTLKPSGEFYRNYIYNHQPQTLIK